MRLVQSPECANCFLEIYLVCYLGDRLCANCLRSAARIRLASTTVVWSLVCTGQEKLKRSFYNVFTSNKTIRGSMLLCCFDVLL